MKTHILILLMSMFSLTAMAACSTESADPIVENSDNNGENNGQTADMDYSKFPLSDGENGKAPLIRLRSLRYEES